MVAGRVCSIELENFMCHTRLKLDFDIAKNNCFYIGGANGCKRSQDWLKVVIFPVFFIFLTINALSHLLIFQISYCSW